MKRFKYGLTGLLMAIGLTAALPAVADEVVAYAAGGWFAVDSRAVKDTTLSGGAIIGGETNLVLQCSPSAWGAVSGGSGVTVAYSNATSGAVGTIAAQTADPMLDWTPPAEKGTYELTHQPVDASGNPLGTALIAKFEVEVPVVPILARPEMVDNTTLAVYTNGVLSSEVETGKWAAWSNDTAVVVYTADTGYFFEGGATAKTNTLDTAKNPATQSGVPSAPQLPSVTGVTAVQRYPWNGKVDISYVVSNAVAAAQAQDVNVMLKVMAIDRSTTPWTTNVADSACLFVGPRAIEKLTDAAATSDGAHRIVWDMNAQGFDFVSTNVIFAVSCLPKGGGVQLWENGPYFAECNVGATRPEEFGYYFWWGDTVGYKRNSSNDGWVSSKDDTMAFTFSSGNCPTYQKSEEQLLNNGYIDANGNLVAAYDAATANLGAPWRLPTKTELEALVDNCTVTKINDWNGTGVKGRLVTGKGDYATKSVFFPSAGMGRETDLEYVGLGQGDYWSSTTYPQSPNRVAWHLDSTTDGFQVYHFYGRYYGCPVRPVRIVTGGGSSVLGAGESDPVRADLRTDVVRPTAATETLPYSTAWDGGDEVTLAVNGMPLVSGLTGSGTYAWTPAITGTNVLTHTVVTGGVSVVLTAKFVVSIPIRARPEAVDNTTLSVYTNGVLSAETSEESGEWYAWSNEPAVVVYTARDGFAWEGGVTVVTNELDTTKDPAWNEDYPSKPSPLPMAAAYRYPSYNVEGDPKSGIKEWHDGVTNAIDLAKMMGDSSVTELPDGWYVVTNSVECGHILCSGHVHLILADGCELRSTEGIMVQWYAEDPEWCVSLDVYAQEAGTGKLIAIGGDSAGIGGDSVMWGGNITINGGILDVSSHGGAGIGGYGADPIFELGCTNIVINGGEITATGGGYAAGIGGTVSGKCVDVVINGGVVVAQGARGGAGIGGGWMGSASGIMINGGTVTAAGGEYYGNIGSAIGTGAKYEEYFVPEPATNIFVAGGLLVKAGDDNPPTTMIGHDDTTDLAGVAEFVGKQYATIQPKKSIVVQLKTVYYTTAEVYTNGVLSSEISTGKWAAWLNEPAYVVYTAAEDYIFTNGQTAVTNVIDTSKNPAVAPSVDEPVHMPWVAEADGRKFTTLKKAYDSVSDAEIGTTVRLLSDITAAEPFVIEKNIKLDLNGYDYSGPAAGSFTVIGHTLKVVGTNTVSGALSMMDGEIILYGGTYDTNVNGLEADICEVIGSGPWTVVAKTGEQGGLVVKDKDEEKQGEVTVSYETLSEEGLSTNDLNTVGKNGLKVWESLSLGVDANDASSLPIVKATQQLNESKLMVRVMEVGESKIPEAGVTYQLYGSSNKVDWVECGEPSATPDIEATRAKDGQFYRYYRIESKITITPAVTMCTITFNLNGGTWSFPTTYEVEQGDTFVIPSKPPTFEYGVFGGWKARSGAGYSPGDSITVTEDLALKAMVYD